MDVLSDVLAMVRLQGTIHFCPELTAPWGIQFPALSDRAPFYVLSRGSCYLEVEGMDSPAPLVGGDLVMLPHGPAHILRDRLQSPTIPIEQLLTEGCPRSAPRELHHGGGGAKSALVSGQFKFANQAASRFLAPLPTLIHIRSDDAQSVPWLEATLRFLALESTSSAPGAEMIMERLTDVLFVQILRASIVQNGENREVCNQKAGMLHALVDPQIGQALVLIHQRSHDPWTVAELADQVHMSRTAFAVRFSKLVGLAPLDYLTKWRMEKASDLLRQGEANLEEIALRVGYESGPAFSKAFKREMGAPPGHYRREQLATASHG